MYKTQESKRMQEIIISGNTNGFHTTIQGDVTDATKPMNRYNHNYIRIIIHYRIVNGIKTQACIVLEENRQMDKCT